jgi:hypothetical protein
MEGLWPKLRTVSLLTAGSVLVHELRYVAGYGSNAGKALAEQGHSYLPWIEALASVLLVVSLARFAMTLVRASRGGVPEPRAPRFQPAWLASSAVLAAVYTTQEGFEGTFAPGHPAGLIGVYGHGGWTAIAFSLLVGALIAAVGLLAHQAVELFAGRAVRRARPAPRRAPRPVLLASAARRLDVLAWHLAGRAPPCPSAHPTHHL